jgi:hypothetical protein
MARIVAATSLAQISRHEIAISPGDTVTAPTKDGQRVFRCNADGHLVEITVRKPDKTDVEVTGNRWFRF